MRPVSRTDSAREGAKSTAPHPAWRPTGNKLGKKIAQTYLLHSLKRTVQSIRKKISLTVSKIVDAVSERTGYAAVRVPLQKAKRPREVTLDLTGYRQIDSFSCGGVAAAMAVKFMRPRMSFERIYDTVKPRQETGAGYVRVTRALRSLGVRVSWRKNLSLDDLCDAIDAGSPVLVCIKTKDADTDHWVVAYGYGRRPDLLFIAGRGVHFLARNRMRRREFRRLWSPPGEGLICSKAR